MSSTSTNLAFMTKTAASQFINAKLEDAKSVKNDMTDQQQNFSDIINSFDMSNQLSEASLNKASFNKTSSSKALELSALYQCLNCSHVNVQT